MRGRLMDELVRTGIFAPPKAEPELEIRRGVITPVAQAPAPSRAVEEAPALAVIKQQLLAFLQVSIQRLAGLEEGLGRQLNEVQGMRGMFEELTVRLTTPESFEEEPGSEGEDDGEDLQGS